MQTVITFDPDETEQFSDSFYTYSHYWHTMIADCPPELISCHIPGKLKKQNKVDAGLNLIMRVLTNCSVQFNTVAQCKSIKGLRFSQDLLD